MVVVFVFVGACAMHVIGRDVRVGVLPSIVRAYVDCMRSTNATPVPVSVRF